MKWLFVFILILLIIINGFFSLVEVAVISSKKILLRQAASEGNKKAQQVLNLIEKPEVFLSTIQIGITFIGILTGMLGMATIAQEIVPFFKLFPFVEEYAYFLAVSVTVLFTTYLSLTLGELVPKQVALIFPEKIAIATVGAMNVLAKTTSPLVKFLAFSSNFIMKFLLSSKKKKQFKTEEEIKALLKQGSEQGDLLEIEKNLIERIFYLADIQIKTLMVPRSEVVWVDVNDPPEMLNKILIEKNFTYYPVRNASKSEILGFIKAKDILKLGKIDVKKTLNNQPLFVAENAPALYLFSQFRESDCHQAFVVDEHGDVQGIVLESDALRAITIENQFDLSNKNDSRVVYKLDGSILIDASIPIGDFEQLMSIKEISWEDREGVVTLAGFFIKILGEIPKEGSKLNWGNFEMEVVRMDGMRIDKILLKNY